MNKQFFEPFDPNEEDDLNKKLPIEQFSSTTDSGDSDGDDELDDDDDNEEGDFDSDDPMDDYGTSGEKYGWYNGFSDDVIDDAFDGDPEATWNVD